MNSSESHPRRTAGHETAVPWHIPVLRGEVMDFLRPGPGRVFLDGTLGGGGHTGALLAAGARVVAMDADAESLAHARRRLAAHGDALVAIHANYARASAIPEVTRAAPYDGALLDLGVSSHQLDTPERGFSFLKDGPLDMRLDQSSGRPAAEIVNTAPEEELARIIWEWGEEPRARRIAAAIVRERARRPLARTLQLAALIEDLLGRRGRIHPATRVFQALRIAVNDELVLLREGLAAFASLLRAGARFAVITFHSLEDRIVKTFFRQRSREWLDRPEWPAPRRNPDLMFRDLTRHPVEPAAAEIEANPRARSARLRAVERLAALPQEVAA